MLVNGNIPKGQECPFKEECALKANCMHMGKEHPCDFSCAAARAYASIKRNKGA